MKNFLFFFLIWVLFTSFPSFSQSSQSAVPLELNYADQIDLKWLAHHYQSVKKMNGEPNQSKHLINSEEFKKRLNYLKEKTPLPIEYNPIIEKNIEVFLAEGLETMENIKDRSAYFFPIFDRYLDQYNLPLELKYVAVVESALKPDALSQSGAKGIWQFMLGTARLYDLKVDSYVDERKDIFAASNAACEYLTVLYHMFDDWNLAIAAYNCGPGNVTKAIRRAGGIKNYWQIRPFLPRETQEYVPAFYATLYIFEQAELYLNANHPNGISFFETDTIHVKKQLNLTEIEKYLEIENQLLSRLNPKYTKNIIPKNEYLTLPKSAIPTFLEMETNQITNISADHIANKVVLQDLAVEMHPKKSNEATAANSLLKADIKIETYIVKEGDSLFKISRLYPDVSINQLRTWNNIWGINYVKPGTKLLIYKS